MLVIFSGLPATAKTTLSRLLPQDLKAVYLRDDTMCPPIMAACGDDIADVSTASPMASRATIYGWVTLSSPTASMT